MSGWSFSEKSTCEEILHSEWLSNALNHLGKIVPFSFTVKYDEQIIYSSGDFSVKNTFKLKITDDVFFTLESPYPSESKSHHSFRQFCALVQNIVIEKFRLEFDLNSLSSEILDKYEELNLLYDLSHSLGTLMSPQQIYDIILEKVEKALEVNRTSIMLYKESSNHLEVVATRGFDIDKLENTHVSLEKTISGLVLRKGEALMVDNLKNLPEGIELRRKNQYKSQSFISVPLICSPIQVHQEKIGVINVTEKRSGRIFSSGDLKLLNAIASMAAIAIYNNRLLEKVLESERLKRELEIAETIQLSLLPTDMPYLDDIQVYGRCKAAKNVGGDYFDLFWDKENQLNMLIADVSGHNISAALMMANTRSVLRSLIHESISVSEILRRANHLLFEDMSGAGFFISVFIMRYNRENQWLSYANGGHHPVLWYQTKKKRFTYLDADGLLLGVMPKIQFEEKTVHLEPGDILTMYTDGLIEATNDQGEMFGYKKLKNIILNSVNSSTNEIVDNLFFNFESFVDHKAQSDDTTVQLMKLNKK